jgi:hypothetical protein
VSAADVALTELRMIISDRDSAEANLRSREEQLNDLRHWTHRMLQALDIYWLHCDGLGPRKWDSVRSDSNAEDWWIRFEKYRERVEAAL